MEFIISNWWLILIGLSIIAGLVRAVYTYIKTPSKEQLNSVREWLLYAVAAAEKELGSGTGQLKLRYVYNMFIVRFPFIAKVLPFTVFCTMVDEALDNFKEMLDDNKTVNKYVGYGLDEEEVTEEGEEING